MFLIGIAHNRLIDEQHDLDASGPNPPHGSHYTYDPVGNRLQMNWGIDSSIVYDYDVHQSSPQSWRNRLLGYTQYVGPEVPGQETLEVTYQYSDALIRGNPTRITWHYLHLDPDPEYRSIRPYYDTLKHLWLAYEETWNTDESGNCVDHTRVRATEFRYDSGRARYLVRARDPSTLQPTTQAVWTDYDGDAPYEDYTFAASTSTLTSLTGYLPGLGQRDSASGAKAYHHGDQIDSMRLMTDGAGNVVRRQTYTAFGIPIIEDGPQQTRYGYAGAWGYESVTPPEANDPLPWIHVGERWYDPVTGRFLQRDPIGIEGGLNTYSYVGNHPTVSMDPTGNAEINIFELGPGGWPYGSHSVPRPPSSPIGGGLTYVGPPRIPVDGGLKVYDFQNCGRSHGPIETPHTRVYPKNVDSAGRVWKGGPSRVYKGPPPLGGPPLRFLPFELPLRMLIPFFYIGPPMPKPDRYGQYMTLAPPRVDQNESHCGSARPGWNAIARQGKSYNCKADPASWRANPGSHGRRVRIPPIVV